MTDLDFAFDTLSQTPGDAAARLRYFDCLLRATLAVPVAASVSDDQADPETRLLDGVEHVLAYDGELRLAEARHADLDCLTLSGAELIRLLAPLGVGLLMNPDQRGENAIPPDSVAWLQDLAKVDLDAGALVQSIGPPRAATPTLLMVLDKALAQLSGQAESGILVGVTGADLILFLVGVSDEALPTIAADISAALNLAQLEGVTLDIGAIDPSDPRFARISAIATRE